jgi:hypothetical protein
MTRITTRIKKDSSLSIYNWTGFLKKNERAFSRMHAYSPEWMRLIDRLVLTGSQEIYSLRSYI